jgi:nucleoside-diphosphate-sugar epimerase
MQTILGSGGAIGIELAKVLPQYTNDIRLVSRNPVSVNSGDTLLAADLTQAADVDKAVAGSEVVYITVGFAYSTQLWREVWPALMENVINACKTHGAKLVFFDNVYMYDPAHIPHMTEETPVAPTSNKGQVRKQIAEMLLNAHAQGEVQGVIARAADFYGPSIQTTSVLTETVFKQLAAGKNPQWFASTNYKHAFTYTPDAGKATALLGNTDDAYGQVWHLPTAPNPPTGQAWITQIGAAMNKEVTGVQVLPKWLMRALGIFVPFMREIYEMAYQYDRDYVFDSSKFTERFGVEATPYAQGIAEIIEVDYS